jgi:energy-dependent translational throttle protein EttA
MDVRSEAAARQTKKRVHEVQSGARVPALLRVGQEQNSARAGGSRADEGVDVGIAADHAVQDDDVMGADRRGVGHEVCDAPLDTTGEAALGEQRRRLVLVSRRDLDVRRAHGSRPQELQLDRADASADVEHAVTGHVACELGQPLRRPREASFAIAARILCRDLAAEEPAVLRGSAATGHDGSVLRLQWRPYDGRTQLSSEYIYTMYRADKFYGPDRQVLANISLSFLPGAKIGVLGPNGAGKSTLLRIMAGKEEPSSGVAELAPGATVGFLEQEPYLDPEKDVRGNVEDGVRELRDLLDRFNAISAAFAEPDADYDTLLADQAKVQDAIDRADAWQLEEHLDHAMDALRLPDGERDVTTLSGGERRRVALCRLLLSSPGLLLLDEPTNHLDAESVAWLERFLADYKGTIVAVTHDRYFLDNVAGWILELDRGKGIPFQGNYSSWLEQKQARLAVEEKTESARRRTLARELEWVRLSPKARHAKSKARLGAYEKMLADEQNVKLDKVEMHIPPGPRLGDLVIEAERLQKGFGERLLVEDLTFSLPPAGIVGVVGPNGAGKTTLFRMLAGQETPDAGSLKIGDTVQLAYVDQSRADLDPAGTVWKEISGGHDIIELGKKEINSRQYVSQFNFRGSDQQKRVGDLSGGERNRVHLAKLLRSGGNVLLLDEPTNDLDVDTLRALEDALLDFAGCAVVITHDRWFLDRVATHILAFEGDSQTTWFEGGWADYVEWVKETRGADALEPHRIKYKPLVRA